MNSDQRETTAKDLFHLKHGAGARFEGGRLETMLNRGNRLFDSIKSYTEALCLPFFCKELHILNTFGTNII